MIVLFSRGDHIVPNFEEIWPSKKKLEEAKKAQDAKNWAYYYDAMQNGPGLSGNQVSHRFCTIEQSERGREFLNPGKFALLDLSTRTRGENCVIFCEVRQK